MSKIIAGLRQGVELLERARQGMFSHIRRWLNGGCSSPKTSSMVERVMRELGHKIKKITYGWSDRGVGKIARIILKCFANKDKAKWEKS